MSRIFCALLLAVSMPCLAQQQKSTPSVAGQEAARCAAFYDLLSKYGQQYMLASQALFSAALAEAPASQVAEWVAAFAKELPDRSEGEAKFTSFIDTVNKQCGPLATQAVKTYVERTGPEASAKNKIVKRHKSKRPAEAEVFGEVVTYSDSDGVTCDAPIVQAGTTNRESRIRGQNMWIDDQQKSWKLVRHGTKYSVEPKTLEDLEATKIYSEFAITDKKGKPQTVCFDTTASAKPELRDLISKPH